MSDDHLSELEFSSLELPDPLRRGIEDAGFSHATPIQAQTLPQALAGKDVAGQAQTGTGKTAAFLIALFNRLLNSGTTREDGDSGIRALVLAPTRELAVQIADDAAVLGKHTGLKLGLAYGGRDYEKQRDIIAAGVDVLVGTPGRIIDYFKQRVFHMNQAQVLVLDEADRMFDLGFIKDIRYLLRRLPPAGERLNLLFSATLSYRVMELAAEHMNEPELIRVEPEKVTADRVEQSIYYPSNDEKIPLLIKLMREMDNIDRTMVFVNTKREAERLEDTLNANGIEASAISGDVPQKKRQRMLKSFQEGELKVLIGTDVASRGLHIDDVTHVFNYDLPQDREDYVHRIGRTARAGASGTAISFGCEQYVISLPDIESYIGFRIPVESFDHEDLPEIERPPRRPRRSGPGRGDGRGRSSGGAGRRRSSGGGSGGGGGSRNGSRNGKPAEGEQKATSNEGGDKPARKRRRRRRKPSGETTGANTDA
ncbi:MAG: DEAD/DEAH box helicase [Pseudomonadota bacterium]